MKKFAGDIIIYTYVPKITIIWCTVPEMWSEIGRIFCHFGPFFCPSSPLTTQKIKILKLKKKKHLEIWTQKIPMDTENQNFGKMNNTPEDIIILQMHTINDSHMMYGSWDMKCTRQNFWVTPLTTQKIKILKKLEKKQGDIIILHKCTRN